MALLLPVFLGSIAFAAETIQLSMWRRMMQRQADSGAIAGALALSQSMNVNSTVTGDLARNNFVALTSNPVIENAPTAGSYAGNAKAVRVALSTTTNLPFSTVVLRRSIPINVEATATLIEQGRYCVISLENGNATGVAFGGNTTANIGCGVVTNAIAANAVTASGSSIVTASPIAAVGGIQASASYAVGTKLIPYTIPQADPYASLPTPSGFGNGGTNVRIKPSETANLSPGTYSGMDIQGTVNLAPGVYYINKGTFAVNSQGVVNGTDVTIILTSSDAESNPGSIATVDMRGGATFNVTAPTIGPYADVLFYQDRRALDSGTNKINGNSFSKLQGSLYFPKQEVEFTGDAGANVKCMQLVVRRLIFWGNSQITNECPAGYGGGAWTGTRVKLVG